MFDPPFITKCMMCFSFKIRSDSHLCAMLQKPQRPDAVSECSWQISVIELTFQSHSLFSERIFQSLRVLIHIRAIHRIHMLQLW